MAASDVLRGMPRILVGLVVAGAMSVAVARAQQHPAAHILDSHDHPFSKCAKRRSECSSREPCVQQKCRVIPESLKTLAIA